MSQNSAAVAAEISEAETEILAIDDRLSNTTKAGLIVGSITQSEAVTALALLQTLIGLLVQSGFSVVPDEHTNEQKAISALAVKFALIPRGVQKNLLGLRFLDSYSAYEAARLSATAGQGCCQNEVTAIEDVTTEPGGG